MPLITPPIAPEPYNKVDGPRTISRRSANKGSVALAWSGLTPEASVIEILFCKTATLLPVCPRSIGCPTPTPKDALWTPSSFLSVSPSELVTFSLNSSPESTVMGSIVSARVPENAPVMIISSIRSSSCSGLDSWAPARKDVEARATAMAIRVGYTILMLKNSDEFQVNTKNIAY